MRKKIAVYASGWNKEILDRVLTGMRKVPSSDNLDIFIFTCYAATGNQPHDIIGEESIYDLPDMKDFDGVIILSNNLHSTETVKKLGARAFENKVPAVSVGIKLDGISYMGIDNRTGMCQLVTHLIEDHNAKRLVYIGGTKDHPDSIERLEITKDVLKAHNLTIAEEDIYYANWGYSIIQGTVAKICDGEKGLPDAIVCANDFTALAAISTLIERNISVPEDVIVTGFDSIDMAKKFYPSISSVENDYESIGTACCEYLLSEAARDVDHPAMMTSKSRLVRCESCCKQMESVYEKVRHNFCTINYADTLRNDMVNHVRSDVEYDIISAKDFNSLKMVLRNHYKQGHLVEGNDFHMVLDPLLLQNILEDYKNVWEPGVREKMSVMIAMRNGELLDCGDDVITRHELIPGYDTETRAQDYFFVPLNWEQYYIGYLIFVNSPWVITLNTLFTYRNGIKQALHRLRINMRLDTLNQNLYALYNKDAMTGLYNRFGYESLAVPLFEQQKLMHQPVMVCFLDINYMKHINDKYGHLQGDLAIAIVANAIKRHERDNWIGIRYGGDEFLIIASCSDTGEAEAIKQGILSHVKNTSVEKNLPYDLNVSCGYVLTDPYSSISLQDYIKQADELMYEIKRDIHKND